MPQSARLSAGGGCNCYLGNAQIEVAPCWKVLPLVGGQGSLGIPASNFEQKNLLDWKWHPLQIFQKIAAYGLYFLSISMQIRYVFFFGECMQIAGVVHSWLTCSVIGFQRCKRVANERQMCTLCVFAKHGIVNRVHPLLYIQHQFPSTSRAGYAFILLPRRNKRNSDLLSAQYART